MLALKMRNIFYSVNLIFFKVEAESVRIIVKAENSGLSGREPGEGHLSSSLGPSLDLKTDRDQHFSLLTGQRTI